MSVIADVNVDLTPEQIANEFWALDNYQQADFFEHLLAISGPHRLMLQGIEIRKACEEMDEPDALRAYQYLFAASYKYMGS